MSLVSFDRACGDGRSCKRRPQAGPSSTVAHRVCGCPCVRVQGRGRACARAAARARVCACVLCLAPGVGGDVRDGDGHEMVVSVRILRCNDVCSRDHARCLSIAMMPRETAAPNAASGHGTTAGPTRCAAHRLPAAVTEIGHLRACGTAPWWKCEVSSCGSPPRVRGRNFLVFII
jgi:hypothetical protein